MLGSAVSEPSYVEKQDPAKFEDSVRMVSINNKQQVQTALLQLVIDNNALLKAQRQLTSSAFSFHAGLLFFGVITGAALTLLSWRYRFLLLNKIR